MYNRAGNTCRMEMWGGGEHDREMQVTTQGLLVRYRSISSL